MMTYEMIIGNFAIDSFTETRRSELVRKILFK